MMLIIILCANNIVFLSLHMETIFKIFVWK